MENTLEVVIQNFKENNFHIIKNLGRGNYGKAVMAREKKTGKVVALKLIRKDRTKLEAFLNELTVSIYLSNHNSMIFTHSYLVDSVDHYILTQDLAPAGSLQSLVEPGVGIPEVMVKRCALQLTRALEYMHSKRLVHRDLKPDNVLLMDMDCHQVKLSDFGMTKLAGTLVPAMSPIIPYMSPELCKLKQHETLVLDPSVDIWAFGVLLYVVYTGNYPWKRATRDDPPFKEFLYWQSSADYVSPPRQWTKLNRRAQGLFHRFLSQDPNSRIPITSVLEHLDFAWGVDNLPEETIETEEEDVDMGDYDCDVIVIESEDEFIMVENHRDVECIILSDTIDESFPGSGHSTVMFITDTDSLALGSEVEVT